jgi:hypothetical protein
LLVESQGEGGRDIDFLEIAIITCSRLSLDSGIPCLHLHYLFDLMIEDIYIDAFNIYRSNTISDTLGLLGGS